MIRIISFMNMFFCSFVLYSAEIKGLYMPWTVESSTPDASLAKTQAKLELRFKSNYAVAIQETVLYSFNQLGNKQAKPDKNGTFTQLIKPGKYVFRFFYNENYFEIVTDTIQVKPAHKLVLAISFESSTNPVICDKPVLYFYPEKSTAVHVELKLETPFLFTYPTYQNGWDFTADSTGTLTFDQNKYRYIFWEGTTGMPANPVNPGTGFMVSTTDLTLFFEEKLEQMGFTSMEKADFITYWIPRMQQFNNHKIQFLFTNEFSLYAPLAISPKPDNLLRLFMLWTPMDNQPELVLQPQVLPKLNRTGFTVLEWGGTQLKNGL